MPEYHLIHVKDSQTNNPQRLAQNIDAGDFGEYSMYGTFFGLFGLASNELYVLMMADAPENSLGTLAQSQGFDVLEAHSLEPTVRPNEHAERTKKGIYVFRWFDVLNKDVDEIARLSEQAWVTFEGGFDTEVQGLFAQTQRGGQEGKMLLLTWYRNLTVWEESRQPPQEARDRFAERHRLTRQARPIATRLVGTSP